MLASNHFLGTARTDRAEMAKTHKEAIKKRSRRSDQELITDLKSQIREVKKRQQFREFVKSPTVRSAVKALSAIDRALEISAEHSSTTMRHALSDARKPLVAELERHGFKVPKAKLPRGRRPKIS